VSLTINGLDAVRAAFGSPFGSMWVLPLKPLVASVSSTLGLTLLVDGNPHVR